MNASEPQGNTRLDELIDVYLLTVPSTWSIVRGQLHTVASEHYDISAEQYHILRHIYFGVNTVSQLANVKRISPSAISQGVDILVNRGFVSRTGDANDRRRIELELTPEGEKLLLAIFAETHARLSAQLQELDPQAMQTAIEGLKVLAEIFKLQPQPSLKGLNRPHA